MGVDNAVVMLTESEPPMTDNSAFVVADAIREVGLREQITRVKYLSFENIVCLGEVDEDEMDRGSTSTGPSIYALPLEGSSLYSYHGDYPEPIGEDTYIYNESSGSYLEDVAPARTFVELKDLRAQKDSGMSQGSNQHNCLIYSAKVGDWVSAVRPTTVDEPIRHKVLDLIGDMALVGMRLHGHIKAYKSGHRLQVRVAQRLRAMIQ
jgi:UDP-3-O-acyl-N-acetylglucosamine deacetylase